MADASDKDQIRICMDQVKRWYEALSFDEFLNQVNDAYGSTYLWMLEDQSEYYRLLGSDVHQLPDENELSEEEACRSAAEYLIGRGVVSVDELNALRQGTAYFGKALVGWTVVWMDEQDEIIWQVMLEKYSGRIAESI